ncbi:hypothetical protein CDL15_Pgr006353 [Punica granatum]|uniref:Uncharacterized protein n=1 Tax=Punica granatum TaxID=22663 RepID=A0A218WAL3_PUNGR|nr:hypothetical protein CDL15_Pgr006353 [Punica granatum]
MHILHAFDLPNLVATSVFLFEASYMSFQLRLKAPRSPLSSCDTSASQKSSSSRSLTMAANIATVLLHMPVVEVTLPILLGGRFVDGSSLA